ncbi:Cysteine desulfurase [Anaplasma phagocytophilum]|uniref:aminotransferase class V-fold PLP-dependent enzyme n=1 Tax=Anaplasma phagocytophilum TaxID=948 RepID=UPI0007DE6E81|nr:aminotransferase class V-fold PLP-dependent enzyme [Anaplasma phagocytophilum]SCV64219.1 Cysteine desulfurase [Anaplasma phagocytophilum]
MLMTTRLRYAVMFMVGLVQKECSGYGKPKRASVIADSQSLSEGYLERVISHLKSRGLVKPTRGPGGGYSLGMSPDRITLDMLLDSVGDKVKMVRCDADGNTGCISSYAGKCNSHDLWESMEKYMMHYFANTTILDVSNNTLKELGGGGDYIYADDNASSEVCQQVRHKLGNALLFGNFYNPSAVYGLGQKARSLVEDVRRVVIEALDARGYEVVFTSSGTEANNLVFNSVNGRHIISAIEHPSVMNAAVDPVLISVTGDGVVSLEALEEALKSGDSKGSLVSVMLANNEIGVIQPLKDVVNIAHKYGAVVHMDAVQACGKIPVSVLDIGADFVTISSHKVGGIVGAGAVLYNGKKVNVVPMLRGGMQEKGLRAGTENIPAIYSLAIALENLKDRLQKMSNVASMRDLLEKKIKEMVPECIIWGSGADRIPNTTCISMPGVSSETQLIGFDSNGIAVGVGAACSSGKIGRSKVLEALGASEEDAKNAIRISLGPEVSSDQVNKIIECWYKIYSNFHSLS